MTPRQVTTPDDHGREAPNARSDRCPPCLIGEHDYCWRIFDADRDDCMCNHAPELPAGRPVAHTEKGERR